MKRYYLSPVIGDGSLANPYRPKIRNYLANVVSVILSGPDGTPALPVALVLGAGIDHTGPEGDTEIDAFPDLSLSTTLSVLTTQQRNRLRTALDNRGFTEVPTTPTTTFREVLEGVGKVLNASFSVLNFDVVE